MKPKKISQQRQNPQTIVFLPHLQQQLILIQQKMIMKLLKKLVRDSKSKHSDDDDVEIIRSYPTRSRTTNNEKQKNKSSKTMDSNIFDTENGQTPVEESDNNEEETSDEPWLDEMREQFWFPFLDMLPPESKLDVELSGKFFNS